MPESHETQVDLDAIAERFAAEYRSGAVPNIDDYLAQYPRANADLRELLSSVAMIERLKRQTGASTAAGIGDIQQLDDYRIVREIGRGGMGVVFEAIHQALGRRVAVKVLSADRLGDTKHLARFRIEARAAARLRHSHIVPVFGVGSSGHVYYYVMDYIEGFSLREWLERQRLARSASAPTRVSARSDTAPHVGGVADQAEKESVESSCGLASVHPPPLAHGRSTDYFEWVARIGATTADALEYAHQQGVLHRDIKPGNLLIDKRGEVWVADFGLAKLAEYDSVTRTGDVVGTPQYMPPEAFNGEYHEQSEVYSLGLTLYELLAGRPAIIGKNAGDTIRLATHGVTVAPRQFNARIPRNLETIVLKALQVEAKQRYQSAGALRDDLQRFLAGAPIAARREHLGERMLRWVRREPVVTGLLLATLVSLTALAAVSATAYFRTKSALQAARTARAATEQSLLEKSQALTEAEQQRSRAEKNLQIALATLDQVMHSVVGRSLETDADILGEVTDTTVPNVAPEDAQLLQGLLTFFDELAANNSQDLLSESAIAAQRAGDIYVSLGRLQDAEQAYEEATERYARLLEQSPDASNYLTSQIEVINQRLMLAGLRGQFLRAQELFTRAEEIFEQSAVLLNDPEAKFQVARAHRLFASLQSTSGFEAALPDRVGAGPRPVGIRNYLRRALLKRVSQRNELELDSVEIALAAMDELVSEYPQNDNYRAELARVYRTKAAVLSRARAKPESELAIREALRILEDLLSENRQSQAIRYELAATLVDAEVHGFNQMLRATRAHELCLQLLDSSPQLPRYMALHARSLENIAELEIRGGQTSRAKERLLEAAKVYQQLLDMAPELTPYQTRWASAYEALADLCMKSGDLSDASDYLKTAIRGLQPYQRDSLSPSVVKLQGQRLRQKLARLESQVQP